MALVPVITACGSGWAPMFIKTIPTELARATAGGPPAAAGGSDKHYPPATAGGSDKHCGPLAGGTDNAQRFKRQIIAKKIRKPMSTIPLRTHALPMRTAMLAPKYPPASAPTAISND